MDFFRKAVPVFIAGKSGTVNSQAAFRTVFTARAGREYTLTLTGSTLYRVWLNGEVVHYGPARGPHGYVRVDRISLDVRDGENYLAVEVAGYNCPSFYTMDILSFLQAELCEDGDVIRFTAVNGDFEGVSLEEIRARKCIRYSYQRAFTEVWRLTGKAADGIWNAIWSLDAETLETVDHGKKYMEREWKLPYLGLSPEAVPYERGEFRKKDGFDCYDKRFTRISDEVVGYRCEELSDDVLAVMYGDMIPVEGDLSMPLTVSTGDYAALDFGRIYAGFIRLIFRAKVKTTAYIFFSEKPRDGRIDIGVEREEKVDIIKLDIDPADETRTFESFECYSLKYLGVMVESGEIDILRADMREYRYDAEYVPLASGDGVLDLTHEAAFRTFTHNTLDTFMDCPGRERGGWLCDSWFTALSAFRFTGSLECERIFLENFIRAESFPLNDGGTLPDGLLPMCYPGELTTSRTISSWTLWFVYEVYEYGKRGGDIAEFKGLIDRILTYFDGYTNCDGLLEKIPTVFVEPTRANRWTYDVNYPMNMLWAKVLDCVSEMYDRPALAQKAEGIRVVIRRQSFDGVTFFDHSERAADGTLVRLPDRSRICQAEAVFFGIADLEAPEFAVFREKFIDNFTEFPDIEPLHGFIGYAVRAAAMLRAGLFDEDLAEIRATYGKCAAETGTLWEDMKYGSSIDHGFSSFIAVVIEKCLGRNSDLSLYGEKK